MRNNSHRYSTHAEATYKDNKEFMNLPNLNNNSAFGNHAYDSSDDDEPGKRSFT